MMQIISFAATGSTMHNCNRGIYTEYSNLRATGLTMTDMRTGIFSTRCTNHLFTEVTGCSITANFRGIDWYDNDGAAYMRAENNEIIVSGNPNGIGIFLDELNPANSANYYISGNYNISITSGMAGIVTRSVNNAQINYNYINQNHNGTFTNMDGIVLFGGSNSMVNCNVITCIDPNYTNTTGISTRQSSNNTILCNDLNGNGTGALFGGMNCGGTRFKGNTMRNNSLIGLELNQFAAIGIQEHFGNIWYNYAGPFGAVNWNINNLGGSEFRVNSTLGTPLFPFIDLGINNGWFFQQFGQTYSCAAYTVCDQFLAASGDDYYERSIATDSVETENYVPESRSIAREYLFEKLALDSALLANDSLYMAFYNENDSSTIGQLYEVKAGFSILSVYDSTLKSLVIITDSLMQLNSDSLYFLDSLNSVSAIFNYDSVRNNLIGQLAILRQTRENIIQLHYNQTDSLVNVSAIKNSAVITAELPENNTRIMNEMFVNYVRGGRDSIAPNYAQVLAIANQCPYAGGPAVYRARSFVALFNDSMQYDDQAVCLQSGIFRNTYSYSNNEQKKFREIIIIPNPANEQIDLLFQTAPETECLLIITDLVGKTVFEKGIDCNVRRHSVNIRHLAPGAYIVKAKMGSFYTETVKLIIAR